MTFDAGQLVERVRFEPRAVQPADDIGNVEGEFDTAAPVLRWALFLMRPGSEAMTEARLAGRQPVTVVTRWDSATAAVTPDWRMTDVRTGFVYAIQAAADMDRGREWMTFVCEAGVAP